MEDGNTRRSFLQMVGASAALGLSRHLSGLAQAAEKPIQGFEQAPTDPSASKNWQPISDRKIRRLMERVRGLASQEGLGAPQGG